MYNYTKKIECAISATDCADKRFSQPERLKIQKQDL